MRAKPDKKLYKYPLERNIIYVIAPYYEGIIKTCDFYSKIKNAIYKRAYSKAQAIAYIRHDIARRLGIEINNVAITTYDMEEIKEKK